MSSSDVKSMGRALRQIDDPATKRILETILSNIDTLKSGMEALKNPDNPGWLDMDIQNNWVQLSDDEVLPQYFKNIYGEVHIRGAISGGTITNGTIIGKLPAGYRTGRVEILQILETTGSGDAHLHISPDGNIKIYNVTSNVELSIECSYFAEN